jgi:hypothetical protein
MRSNGVHRLEKSRAERGEAGTGFWKGLAGVVLGGVIATGTSYLSARWAADYQHQQLLFEHAQSFAEFLSLEYLPRSGDVPAECQARLEECRRLRQAAVQVYLFLPTNVQADLVKSFGPDAAAKTYAENVKGLSPEAAAGSRAIMELREWLWGRKDANFNFILPCGDWRVEEKACRKAN